MKFEQPTKEFLLEEQFNNQQIIEFGDKKLKVIDVKPEIQKTEIPTVLIPGWNATPDTFRNNIIDLARLNRRVISINAPHGIKTERSGDSENIPEAEWRKISALIEVLDKKSIDKVDVIAHSEGGYYVSLAATLYPDKFRNLVLIDPAGTIGKDNIKRLAKDFAADIFSQAKRGIRKKEIRKAIRTSSKEATKSFIKNPKQSIKEAIAISNSDIHLILENLKAQGIGISIIHAVDDKAFPMERVQNTVKTRQVEGFYSVKGSHNEIFLNHEKYSKLADKALSDLEKRSK